MSFQPQATQQTINVFPSFISSIFDILKIIHNDNSLNLNDMDTKNKLHRILDCIYYAYQNQNDINTAIRTGINTYIVQEEIPDCEPSQKYYLGL